MTFSFRPAVRENAHTLIALAGPSGGGKSFSALRLASGLVGPDGVIAAIDTEAGRLTHYADRFRFLHCDMRPPFRPDAYLGAIDAALKAGAGAIIIDSMSHEYEGEGGLQDWAADLEAKGVKSPGNWKEPKTAHKRMMSRLLQCRAHLIFCLRAEEKIRIEKDPRTGKTIVVPAGWAPICEKRFMYEMTASFLLLDDAPGVPRPIKLQDQHKPFFPETEPISERSGQMLAEWARGTAPGGGGIEQAMAAAKEAAEAGSDAFRSWWQKHRQHRAALRPHLEDLKAIALKADARIAEEQAGGSDDSFAEPPADGDYVAPQPEIDPETGEIAEDKPAEPSGLQLDWQALHSDLKSQLAHLIGDQVREFLEEQHSNLTAMNKAAAELYADLLSDANARMKRRK